MKAIVRIILELHTRSCVGPLLQDLIKARAHTYCHMMIRKIYKYLLKNMLHKSCMQIMIIKINVRIKYINNITLNAL